MRKLISALIIVLSISATALAQGTEATAKAEEILKKARAAIGDESKLNTLQSLSFSGTTRRSFGEQQMESETEYEMIFPDRFRRTDSSQFGSITFALNRDQVWQEFVPGVGMGPGGGGRGGGMMRFPGGGNPNDPAVQERIRNMQRAEFARLLLGMLLFSPSSFPVEFTYLGEAKSPDGTAHTILAKGPGEFKLALYFDQQTYKLLMMNYKGRQFMQRGRGPGGGPGGPGGGGGPGGRGGQTGPGGQGEQRPQMTPEEMEKRRKEFEERMAKLPEVEFRWVFGDYKNVGGLNLPHRLTKSEAGKPNEEFEISKYKINPKISPDKFVKNEKEKSQ
jgi:outer membrane lipoprotein-sorting protein